MRQGPRFEFRVNGLLFTAIAASLEEVIMRTKSLLKGVICSQRSVFKHWGRESWRDRTLALPETTLIITIFFSSSFDFNIASVMGRETRREAWLVLTGIRRRGLSSEEEPRGLASEEVSCELSLERTLGFLGSVRGERSGAGSGWRCGQRRSSACR